MAHRFQFPTVLEVARDPRMAPAAARFVSPVPPQMAQRALVRESLLRRPGTDSRR